MKKLSISCAFALALLSAYGFSWGDFGQAQAQSERSERLNKGDILVKKTAVRGSDLPKFTVSGVIDAPVEEVWKVAIDCQNYHKWYRSLASSSLVKKAGDEWVCREEAKLPFPLSNLDSTVRVTLEPGGDTWVRRWEMIEGDYEVNEGRWVLRSFEGDRARTLATYTVHVEPKIAIPDGLMRRAQAKKLPEVIEDLRQEVAKR